MKRIITFLCVLGIYKVSFSQNNVFPPSGNVGIGTTNANNPLTVEKDAGSSAVAYFNSRNTVYGYGIAINTEVNNEFTYAINAFRGGNVTNSFFWLGTNGKLGIGTISPQALFQVGTPGAGTWQSALFQDGLGVAPSGSRKHTYLYSNGTDYYGINAVDYDNNIYLPLSLGWGGANVFIARDGGNVGIGTTTPNEKLSVNGKIRAQEIKVENTNWPDYVFQREYKLLSLAETEKYIAEKGHLPDIPSALEVKNNGVDLGEMNAKLLQKVEELTLHLIEKDKQLTEEKRVNSDHEKRIQLLEDKLNKLIQ